MYRTIQLLMNRIPGHISCLIAMRMSIATATSHTSQRVAVKKAMLRFGRKTLSSTVLWCCKLAKSCRVPASCSRDDSSSFVVPRDLNGKDGYSTLKEVSNHTPESFSDCVIRSWTMAALTHRCDSLAALYCGRLDPMRPAWLNIIHELLVT